MGNGELLLAFVSALLGQLQVAEDHAHAAFLAAHRYQVFEMFLGVLQTERLGDGDQVILRRPLRDHVEMPASSAAPDELLEIATVDAAGERLIEILRGAEDDGAICPVLDFLEVAEDWLV